MWPITEETLQQPPDKLTIEILARKIMAQAEHSGVPVLDVTHDMAKRHLEWLAAQDSDSVGSLGLEKGFKRAMLDCDLSGAGVVFLSHLNALKQGGRLRILASDGAGHRQRMKAMRAKSAKERRKAVNAEQRRWLEIAARPSMAGLSNSDKARKIVLELGLDAKRIRSIRGALDKHK